MPRCCASCLPTRARAQDLTSVHNTGVTPSWRYRMGTKHSTLLVSKKLPRRVDLFPHHQLCPHLLELHPWRLSNVSKSPYTSTVSHVNLGRTEQWMVINMIVHRPSKWTDRVVLNSKPECIVSHGKARLLGPAVLCDPALQSRSPNKRPADHQSTKKAFSRARPRRNVEVCYGSDESIC